MVPSHASTFVPSSPLDPPRKLILNDRVNEEPPTSQAPAWVQQINTFWQASVDDPRSSRPAVCVKGLRGLLARAVVGYHFHFTSFTPYTCTKPFYRSQ